MKKRVFLFLISIILVFVVLFTSTYALIFKTDKLANDEKYTTGILDIEINNVDTGLGNVITLTNAFPMSNTEGKNTTPYRFRITNNGNLDYNFNLTLTKSGTISGTYVKVMADGNEPVRVSSSPATVATGLSLLAGDSKIIELRVWLDENTPNSEMGKTFTGTLAATGSGQSYVNASEKVISLSQGATWSSGATGVYATNSYVEDGETKYHEYRYIGAEPNNWVKFNGDDYRIIGAFDEYSWGAEGNTEYGTYLLKLVSANEIGSFAWGTYNAATAYTTYSAYKNNWTGNGSVGNEAEGTGVPAGANILLNEYYFNPSTTSTYGICENLMYFYTSNTYKTKDCSMINRYGIASNNLRDYIEDVTWYLYGPTNMSINRANLYQCERNNYSGCTSANSGKYEGTAYAKIGLIYVSDYVYASGNVSNSYSSTLTDNSNFMVQNWMFEGNIWFLTPKSDSDNYAFCTSGGGRVTNCYTVYGYSIRPTFYLKPGVKIKSGDGSPENPYVIN